MKYIVILALVVIGNFQFIGSTIIVRWNNTGQIQTCVFVNGKPYDCTSGTSLKITLFSRDSIYHPFNTAQIRHYYANGTWQDSQLYRPRGLRLPMVHARRI